MRKANHEKDNCTIMYNGQMNKIILFKCSAAKYCRSKNWNIRKLTHLWFFLQFLLQHSLICLNLEVQFGLEGSSLTGKNSIHFIFGPCALKPSTVECRLILSIDNFDWPSINTWSILDRLIWVDQHSADYQPTVDQVSIECQSSIDWYVDWVPVEMSSLDWDAFSTCTHDANF